MDDRFFDELIDEVRIADVSRSPDSLAHEHASVALRLVTLGAGETTVEIQRPSVNSPAPSSPVSSPPPASKNEIAPAQ